MKVLQNGGQNQIRSGQFENFAVFMPALPQHKLKATQYGSKPAETISQEAKTPAKTLGAKKLDTEPQISSAGET